jgi:nitroreductase
VDLQQAIHSRRAVREYTEENIGQPVLQRLIDAAIQAPSAVNEQPWLFTVVQDRMLLSLISREAKAHLLRISRCAGFTGRGTIRISTWRPVPRGSEPPGSGSQGWRTTPEGKAMPRLPANCLPLRRSSLGGEVAAPSYPEKGATDSVDLVGS